MPKIPFLLLVVVSGILADGSGFKAFKFQQDKNIIKPERFEVVRYDKNYFKYISLTTFKFNRTCAAMNLTFWPNVEIGNNLQVVVQLYKFLSNEYRLFPIRFQINTCDAITEDAIGVGNFRNCGNFSQCPIRKDVVYNICNWTIDGAKFPPLIPSGQYMVDLQGMFHGVDVGLFRLYIAISSPPPLPTN